MQIEYAAGGLRVPDRSASLNHNRAQRKRQRGSLSVAVQNHLKLIERQGFMSPQDQRSLDAAQAELIADVRRKVARILAKSS